MVRDKISNIKRLNHFTNLGLYDFIDIQRVDNKVNGVKVSLLTLEVEDNLAETWTAILYSDFIDFIKDLTK